MLDVRVLDRLPTDQLSSPYRAPLSWCDETRVRSVNSVARTV